MKICVTLDSSVYFSRSLKDCYANTNAISEIGSIVIFKCTRNVPLTGNSRSQRSSRWERDQSCLHVQLTFQFSMVYREPPTDRGSDSIASPSDPWSLFSLQTAIR